MASLLLASLEPILLPFWSPKLKILPKPPCTPETFRRSPKIMPRRLQKPQRGSKKSHKTLERAPAKLQNWLTEAFEASLFEYNAKLQLAIRSVHLTSSTVGSLKLEKSRFHRKYVPVMGTISTFRSSQCTLKCCKFIAEGSQVENTFFPIHRLHDAVHGPLCDLYILHSAKFYS